MRLYVIQDDNTEAFFSGRITIFTEDITKARFFKTLGDAMKVIESKVNSEISNKYRLCLESAWYQLENKYQSDRWHSEPHTEEFNELYDKAKFTIYEFDLELRRV